MSCKRLALLFSAVILSVGFIVSRGTGNAENRLTSAERAYLKAHGPIRYAPDPSFPPFEFFDASGRPAGITPDLLALLGKRLGIEIKVVRYPTWSDVLAAVKRGEVDMLGTLTRTPEREKFLLYSKPYLSVPYVLFVRDDTEGISSLEDLGNRRLGVVKNYGINDWLSSTHPELRPLGVESPEAGLSQLSTGGIDAFLETLPVGLYLVREKSLSNVRMVRGEIYETPQHLAVLLGHRELLDILQKGLDSLTPAERSAAFVRWTGQDFSRSSPLVSPLARNVLIVLLCLVVVGTGWVYALRRSVHRQTRALRESEAILRGLYRQAAEQEELYKSLLGSIPDPVVLYALDGEARFLNASFTQTFGFTLDEVRGRRIPFVPEGEGKRTFDEIQQVLGGRSSVGFETRRLAKDGRVVEISLSSSVYRDPEGKPAGIVVILRDVTEQKRAEQEKAALEEQLRQAQKMEAIGTLAGGIAHDFNNILAAIVGYADLTLRLLPAGHPQRGNLEQILKAGFRARDLVQQILALSRRSPLERRSLNWAPLVKEALKLLRATIPSTIEIREQIDPLVGNVLADPTHLHQVLMNLCTNAAYAMKEAGGLLEVCLERTEIAGQGGSPSILGGGQYIRLTVRDTGGGMDTTTRQRIFEPYFTTKPVGEGSGLGLAVVHGIVAGLGGAITVRSEPGLGSTFEVYLPLVEEAEATEPLPKGAPAGGTERILLVDDEPAVADAGRQMLEALGYTVFSTTSSAEALQMFAADPAAYDLVVTDQTLPHLTGEALTKRLLSVRSDLPVVICTGYSDILNDELAHEAGARELLMKPFDTCGLAGAVRRALDGLPKPG